MLKLEHRFQFLGQCVAWGSIGAGPPMVLVQLLIEHWQPDRPLMVGHDFGGLAVLRCHFINGIEYGAMHLIDPVAILPSGSPLY